MKRTCAYCSRPLLVKDTAREHHDWRTDETSYRCRDDAEVRVRRLIARTRDALGLQARP